LVFREGHTSFCSLQPESSWDSGQTLFIFDRKRTYNFEIANKRQHPTMKLLFALLTLAPAAAFVPATFGRPSFALASSRPDSKAAVDAALEASKTFGATSPEARLAWENVEEMDASDNRYVLITNSLD
jgi:hypothetical protein